MHTDQNFSAPSLGSRALNHSPLNFSVPLPLNKSPALSGSAGSLQAPEMTFREDEGGIQLCLPTLGFAGLE